MIVVSKRISLEFLGEQYKDSYIEVKSIAFKELEALQSAANEAQKTNSLDFLEKEIASRFIGGQIAQDGRLVPITAEDLSDLPIDVYTRVFQEITGVQTDPKL